MHVHGGRLEERVGDGGGGRNGSGPGEPRACSTRRSARTAEQQVLCAPRGGTECEGRERGPAGRGDGRERGPAGRLWRPNKTRIFARAQIRAIWRPPHPRLNPPLQGFLFCLYISWGGSAAQVHMLALAAGQVLARMGSTSCRTRAAVSSGTKTCGRPESDHPGDSFTASVPPECEVNDDERNACGGNRRLCVVVDQGVRSAEAIAVSGVGFWRRHKP